MSRFKQSAVASSVLVLGGTAFSGGAQAQQPDWTYAYVGAHVGYDWTGLDFEGGASTDDTGAIGGVLAGINFFHSGNFVLGVESDISWTDANGGVSGSQIVTGNCNTMPFDLSGVETTSVSADVNWKATLRGRAGMLLDPAVLVYGTAGVAWANVDVTGTKSTPQFNSGNCLVTQATTTDDDSRTHFGGVFGSGAEMQLTPEVFGRLEVLYFTFQDKTYNLGGSPINIDLDETVVRAAITLRLD